MAMDTWGLTHPIATACPYRAGVARAQQLRDRLTHSSPLFPRLVGRPRRSASTQAHMPEPW